MASATARPTETAMTIWTLRLVALRSANTLRRMSSSSRTAFASDPSRSRRPGPRRLALMISAAMIRSAAGSSRSSANRRSASPIGIRVRSRSTSLVSGACSDGPATRSEEGMPCSRPAAPAIVSRSDSVQVASASSRSIVRRSLAAPPSPRQAKQSTAMPTPATSHRVTSKVAAPSSRATRPRSDHNSRIRSSRLVRCGAAGLGFTPRTATISRKTPAPASAPAAIARRGYADPAISPPLPRRVVAVDHELVDAADRGVRYRPAVRARGEHLAGQHPAVHSGHLPDGADEAAEPAAAGVLVPLVLEHHEIDRAGDEHVRRIDRQPLSRLDRVRADAVEDLEGGVRVDRGQRAVVALGHRVEHGDDLVAEHLADDDPAGVHPQRPADE